MSKNFRTRTFTFELYEDNPRHIKCLELLKKGYSYAYIKHNRDVYDEDDEQLNHVRGELKKPHYHVILIFENARYKNALAKELDIEDNLIQKLDNVNQYIVYLTHRDYPQKAQYDISEFHGNLLSRVFKALHQKIEEEDYILEVIDLIENLSKKGYISYTSFIKTLCSYGYFKVYRRNLSIFERIFWEYQGKYHQSKGDNK